MVSWINFFKLLNEIVLGFMEVLRQIIITTELNKTKCQSSIKSLKYTSIENTFYVRIIRQLK